MGKRGCRVYLEEPNTGVFVEESGRVCSTRSATDDHCRGVSGYRLGGIGMLTYICRRISLSATRVGTRRMWGGDGGGRRDAAYACGPPAVIWALDTAHNRITPIVRLAEPLL